MSEETKTFNASEFIKAANEKEHGARNPGKPAEAAAAAAPAAPGKPAEGQQQPQVGEGGETRLPRSARREMNRLREEAAELRGRLKAMEELGVRPNAVAEKPTETPGAKEEDPEPKVSQFKTYDDYLRALGKWEARQETKKEFKERDDNQARSDQEKQFREEIAAMDKKAGEDQKLFADWDQVAKEASEDPEVEFTPADHPTLMILLARSDVRAGVYYHLAKNPAEMEALLAMTKNPEAQIRAFHRLEGRIERLYYSETPAQGEKAAKAPSKDRTETPAKGASPKLPKPSEAVAARGGSAATSEVSPVLADGKTLNPAWREQRNQREGLRR